MHRAKGVTRRSAIAIFATALIAPTFSARAETGVVLVHKAPDCGCCAGWARHLRSAGFEVTVEETSDLQPVRTRLGVPPDLAACHTAEVGGYVIEGHVPAAALRQLLANRPVAIGLAVPGMPADSPGMESGTPRKYDVVLFGKAGRQLFMRFLGTEIAT